MRKPMMMMGLALAVALFAGQAAAGTTTSATCTVELTVETYCVVNVVGSIDITLSGGVKHGEDTAEWNADANFDFQVNGTWDTEPDRGTWDFTIDSDTPAKGVDRKETASAGANITRYIWAKVDVTHDEGNGTQTGAIELALSPNP